MPPQSQKGMEWTGEMRVGWSGGTHGLHIVGEEHSVENIIPVRIGEVCREEWGWRRNE